MCPSPCQAWRLTHDPGLGFWPEKVKVDCLALSKPYLSYQHQVITSNCFSLVSIFFLICPDAGLWPRVWPDHGNSVCLTLLASNELSGPLEQLGYYLTLIVGSNVLRTIVALTNSSCRPRTCDPKSSVPSTMLQCYDLHQCFLIY